MKIPNKDLEDLGLVQNISNLKLWWDSHREDLQYNNKSGELFYYNCVDGSIELYRKVTDIDDLKQAIWDGFPNLRRKFNLN
jgi:hypothetical protein